MLRIVIRKSTFTTSMPNPNNQFGKSTCQQQQFSLFHPQNQRNERFMHKCYLPCMHMKSNIFKGEERTCFGLMVLFVALVATCQLKCIIISSNQFLKQFNQASTEVNPNLHSIFGSRAQQKTLLGITMKCLILSIQIYKLSIIASFCYLT